MACGVPACSLSFAWRVGCLPAPTILHGVWCPKCARVRKSQIAKKRNTQRLSIEEMRRTAAAFGGECLSTHYSNAHTKLRWKCKNGHEWDAVANSVRSGTWCPICAGRRGLVSFLDEASAIAKSRGGECLSEKFLGDQRKLKWECSEKHQWEAVLYRIRRGSWCPECSGSLGERLVRACMEQLFQHPFPRMRPQWLTGTKKVPLELDGYCETLGIAFEHHGLQHFKPVSWTGKSSIKEDRAAFVLQQQRDARKLRICESNGVKVLVIPEIPTILSIEDVKSKIEEELTRLGIPLPDGFTERRFDFSRVYSTPIMRETEADLQRLAAERGGLLVSSSYRGIALKARWRCADGHEWEAVCASVKLGTWCPRCSGRIVTLDDAKAFATARGGICLSKTYRGSLTPMLWMCGAGHRWKRNWEQTKGGAWCAMCGSDGRRDSRLEEMKKIARARGGFCLSSTYSNPRGVMSCLLLLSLPPGRRRRSPTPDPRCGPS